VVCDFGSDNRIEKDVERCPENYRGGTKIEIETFWPLEVAPENCFGPPENEEISRRILPTESTWGAPYQCIRQLFQATVATRMDYGTIIWHRPKADGSTASSNQARKFTTVQRLAMKATTGCYRTTPTVAMELESATQPAWLRLQTKVLSAMARMQSLHSKHPLKQWIVHRCLHGCCRHL